MSGNEGPDAEQVVAGFANAREHVTAQFANDPVTAGCRFAFALVCFISSIVIHLSSQMKLYHGNFFHPPKPSMKIIWALGMVSCVLCGEGFYTPLINAFFQITHVE